MVEFTEGVKVDVGLFALENVPLDGVDVHVPVTPVGGVLPDKLTAVKEQTWVSLPTSAVGVCCNTVMATRSLAVSMVQALASSKIY
jgi:hypothetical protein